MKVLGIVLLALLAMHVECRNLAETAQKITFGFATGYIINGTDAEEHSAPYIISLGSNYLKHSHICGGTIIAKDWVLTAGHCVTSDPVNMSVIAGLHIQSQVDEKTQSRRVDFGRVHSRFGGGVGPFDIAILHVSESFEFNEYVTPATLPSHKEIHSGPTKLYGWGMYKYWLPTVSSTLQTVETQVVEWDNCREIFPESAPLAETNLCSDSLGLSISACSGDSGGPLVVEHENAPSELIGIVSWGSIPCGVSNMPSVYTRVSAYNDWITQIQSAYYLLN